MHIVLCCNQGMSTSMLVKKMREAAVKNGVDVQIDAYPISEIEEKAPDAAVILLFLVLTAGVGVLGRFGL